MRVTETMTAASPVDEIGESHALEADPQAPSPKQDFEVIDAQANVVTREDVPQDGGFGWVCVVCVLLINAHTWGVNSVGLDLA